jgi:WD40 repeat protein
MRTLRGYQKPVVALAVSPDGARLFSAAKGQTRVWVWDLATGEVEGKWPGFQGGGIVDLAVSPDGAWLLSANARDGLTAWRVSGDLDSTIVHTTTSSQPTVSFHPDGRRAAFPGWERVEGGYRPGVQIWDLAGNRRLKMLPGHSGEVYPVAFSPGGALIASGATDQTVRLWDVETGQEVQCLQQYARPLRLAFRPDGKLLAVNTSDSVRVWDLARGERIVSLRVDGASVDVSGVGYSPDGAYLATVAGDGVVRLYDATHALVGQRHLEIGKLTSMAWLPDSSGLAAGGEKLIAVCEVAELLGEQTKPKRRGEPLSLAGHAVPVEGLRYSPDGRALLSWGRRGQRMWDLSGGAGQARPAAGFVSTVCYHPSGASWSPDGNEVALHCGYSGYVIDSRSGAALHDFTTDQWGMHLTFTPDDGLFRCVWTRENELPGRLELLDGWNAAPLHATRVGFRPHEILTTCFPRADDTNLYFAIRPGDVYRWVPQTDEVVRLFGQKTAITHLEVSADGGRFLTTAGSTASVRRLGDKKALELKHPLTCSGAAFLPAGSLLTACYDGLVRVWDAEAGSELFAFDLGMGRVNCLAVAPDFMTFAAGVERECRVVLMDVPE